MQEHNISGDTADFLGLGSVQLASPEEEAPERQRLMWQTCVFASESSLLKKALTEDLIITILQG